MGQNTKPITGGCLCGAVRYETTAEPIGACHCHCDRCRRHTGSLFASAVGFSTEDITWTNEQPAMFQSSDNCGRLFCARCGSTLGQQWLDILTTRFCLANTLRLGVPLRLQAFGADLQGFSLLFEPGDGAYIQLEMFYFQAGSNIADVSSYQSGVKHELSDS